MCRSSPILITLFEPCIREPMPARKRSSSSSSSDAVAAMDSSQSPLYSRVAMGADQEEDGRDGDYCPDTEPISEEFDFESNRTKSTDQSVQ